MVLLRYLIGSVTTAVFDHSSLVWLEIEHIFGLNPWWSVNTVQ